MRSLAVILASVLTLACDDYRPLPQLPTSATPTAAPPAPAPVPPPVWGVTDYTTIRLGETVSRRVVNPPNCVGDPWPCQYFRLTTTGAGMLIADLTFDSVTQQGQGVDLTIEDASGRRVWAQDFTSRTTRVMARVADMTEIQITLWYTYDDLQFELRTALELSSRVP